jgi:hypothetical protein
VIPKPKKRKRAINIVKQLDALVREIITERDDKKCVICRSWEYPQASHFFGKGRYPRLRWNLENVHINCRSCHFMHHHGSQIYIAWWMNQYGTLCHAHMLETGSRTMSSAERKAFLKSELIRLTAIKERM